MIYTYFLYIYNYRTFDKKLNTTWLLIIYFCKHNINKVNTITCEKYHLYCYFEVIFFVTITINNIIIEIIIYYFMYVPLRSIFCN